MKTRAEYDKQISLLKQEIEELSKKEIYVLGYHYKKGATLGGGKRVRALNRDEAMEIGREYFKEELKDKNFIFYANTLKELDESIALGRYAKKSFITQINTINQAMFEALDLEPNVNYKFTVEEIG